MPDEELGVIVGEEEGDSTPLLPVPRHEVAVTNLFGDASPLAVVERATEIAKVLSAIIEDRQLYREISGRKHVYVEGWTLLGSMLGVFPIVEWTRKTEDGWEARVEARTLNGALVGSAETMCSRAESKWKSRDDYAIRSMAQTRASSKALRMPLGFVMTLAGYDATPSEEMDFKDSGAGGGRGGSRATAPEYSPARNLPPGFADDGTLGPRLVEAMQHIDPTIDWKSTFENANVALFGKPRSELDDAQKTESMYRLANAVAKLIGEGGDFPPPSTAEIAAAFAYAFDGVVVAVEVQEIDDEPAPLSGADAPEIDQSITFGDSDAAEKS